MKWIKVSEQRMPLSTDDIQIPLIMRVIDTCDKEHVIIGTFHKTERYIDTYEINSLNGKRIIYPPYQCINDNNQIKEIVYWIKLPEL